MMFTFSLEFPSKKLVPRGPDATGEGPLTPTLSPQKGRGRAIAPGVRGSCEVTAAPARVKDLRALEDDDEDETSSTRIDGDATVGKTHL